jgi:hypothetical protein
MSRLNNGTFREGGMPARMSAVAENRAE